MEWQPIERWADVGDSSYQVSDLGRVRRNGKLIGQWPNSQGYMVVRLAKPRRQVRVHRMVAEAFSPNPEGKPFVNHIDCDRANNRAENLEWCTQLENLRHSARLGRMQRNHWKGKRSPNAALSDAQVREIRRLYGEGNFSWEALGRLFEISKRSIGRIVNGEYYANA